MILLLLRWKESGHFPLSNLYESLMFLSWSFTLIHLFIEIKIYSTLNIHNIKNFKGPTNFNSGELRGGLRNTKKQFIIGKFIGCITSPIALFTNAFATLSLPKEMQGATPLVPALQSNWLMMHVTVMILSYAALILGSLLSIAFLILTSTTNSTNKEKESIDKKYLALYNVPHNVLEGTPNIGDPKHGGPQTSYRGGLGGSFAGGSCAGGACAHHIGGDSVVLGGAAWGTPNFFLPKLFKWRLGAKLPPAKIPPETWGDLRWGELRWGELRSSSLEKLAKTLDNLSYRILGIGFPFLTIGILSGAVWANEAWGSYWSWDPKETWALLTWLVFAIYLHTRLTKGWVGKKPAIIASLGFVTVWICFLGVNLIGEGLHSYGWLVKS
uniref:Cytochrome c biogenesis protein CcsA n=1 Tax=Borodinellopsis insignis TaxID=3229915 RepID=A0AB39U3R8_9CHLO